MYKLYNCDNCFQDIKNYVTALPLTLVNCSLYMLLAAAWTKLDQLSNARCNFFTLFTDQNDSGPLSQCFYLLENAFYLPKRT